MINSRSSASYSTSRRLHPLSLLSQLISRQVSGCLKLSAQTAEWRLLFDKGQLNFATNSADAFERLDRQLQMFGGSIPQAAKDEMRTLFEHSEEVDDVVSRDYRAVSWLVEKTYISGQQCAELISAIAIEVIASFLNVREGSYELISQTQTEGIPTYCRLDLRPIVEVCQRSSQRRIVGRTTYTVACIDDSPTVLNAIQKFLENQSLSVVAINDPVKALMQIVRSKPDLILLDITMPNLDGYELCALLRRHPRYKRTPIVMVTGNTGLIDRARAKLVRASGYLTKPFTQSNLLKMVFKHLPTKGQ